MSVTFYAYRDNEPVTSDHEVNVSNANAMLVLSALGLPASFEDGLCGHDDAGTFLGRVLLAMAISPDDAGVPSRQLNPGEAVEALGPFGAIVGGATVYDMGRRSGYLQERLGQLHALAEDAVSQSAQIAWA